MQPSAQGFLPETRSAGKTLVSLHHCVHAKVRYPLKYDLEEQHKIGLLVTGLDATAACYINH